ncbi:MAG TPA: DUF2950 family protein [Bryobacteraceae bacterium]|jgi:hypothetical protein|nr:DUF2950 family protein [Bryobacteraceae bacterium]
MKREMMNTFSRWIQKPSRRSGSAMISFAILAMWATAGAHTTLAEQSAQQTFASAGEASQSLFQAVQHNNAQAIAGILGGSTDLASCGDKAQDQADRELFVKKYQEMHRLGREADGSVTLYIGAENWPFPIPLVEKNGAWRFDADAGQREVLYRQIGENEFTAIAISHDFVAAEKQYRAQPNNANPEDSFPASLVAKAAGESVSSDPVLFHGYYFQVLAISPAKGTRPTAEDKTPGVFALIAYPAKYRSSGVMTFVVTNNDVVYQKDLGANTSALASAMTTFHQDASWHTAAE